MNISKSNKDMLIQISQRYSEIHEELSKIENVLKSITSNKNQLIAEIKNLRESEVSLINKIEKDIGRPIKNNDLIELIN
jgi:septation ring formation regulator EzrA